MKAALFLRRDYREQFQFGKNNANLAVAATSCHLRDRVCDLPPHFVRSPPRGRCWARQPLGLALVSFAYA